MGMLAKAVTLFLTVSAAARPTTAVPWGRIPAGLFLTGACFAIFTTAAGFLLAAIYLALAPIWGAGWAAFAVGAGLLPIGGIFAFALYNLVTRPISQPGNDLSLLTDEAIRGVEAAEDWVANRPITALGGALLVGAVASLIFFNRPRR
ncbi:hypothetical protein [Emcibacter sp. SYSU 3D8]|uniref:hypothetical protein n=1 Tax=Emcibacter sp. SYSU 3D8 TaxID=3133969 RepID=UPI0031FE8594